MHHEVISFLEAIRRDMEDNIYNYTVDGKCCQCGRCCSRFLPLSKKEIKTIHEYVRKNNIQECKHIFPLAKEPLDMACPFLDMGKKTEKCRIYPARPDICHLFICDNKQRAKHNRKPLSQTSKVIDMKEEFYGY